MGTLYPEACESEEISRVNAFFDESEYQKFKLADNTGIVKIVTLLNRLQNMQPI